MASPQARTQLRRRPPGACAPASCRSHRAALRAFRHLRRLRLAAPRFGTSTGIQATSVARGVDAHRQGHACADRSEEHTSELQSQSNLVCRLLLEKKKKEHRTKLHDWNS